MEGNYPDPYDCNAYHSCIKQDDGTFRSDRHNCAEDRAYDPLTESCRFKPDHETCKKTPIPNCRRAMQTGPLKWNNNIYYICVSRTRVIDGVNQMVPLMYRCRSGQVFMAKNHTCVENETYNFSCTSEGMFIDTENIRGYYLCNANLTYIRKLCDNGTYFNFDKKSCLPIPELEYNYFD